MNYRHDNELMRKYLQNELLKRCEKNPHYSLRSFAKSLEISPSALSAILNKKRNLTDKTAKRLALKLDFSLSKVRSLLSKKKNQHILVFSAKTL